MPSEVSLMNRRIKNTKRQDDPLTPLLDEYFMKRDASPNRCTEFDFDVLDRPRPPGRLSPSSICGCLRAATFRFTGVAGSTLISPEQQAIFDDGKWRHLRLDWQFLDMQAVLGPDVFEVISIEEHVTKPDLFISGYLDIVVRINGLLYVIDFKGINGYGFDHLVKQGKPKHEHVLQLITYERLRRIRRGFLLYESKNDNRQKVFVVNWTPRLWQEVITWCKDVTRMMRRRHLPPMHPDCSGGTFLYGKCPYAKICYGTKTNAEIERMTFKNFDGVKETWERCL